MLFNVTGMTMPQVSQQITENEINNLVYSLIKFGFRRLHKELDSPPNRIIKNIMLCVVENPTVENIIDITIDTIVREYLIKLNGVQKTGLRTHMKLIAGLFMSEPYELRSDLGEDKDSDEFVTKH